MQFWVRFAGDFTSILLSILLFPSLAQTMGSSWGSALVAVAMLALVLTTVNSLTFPLMQVLPYAPFLMIFGIFAFVANSLLLSMTAGVSKTIEIPLVFDSAFEAGGVGAVTAICATIIVATNAKTYRD